MSVVLGLPLGKLSQVDGFIAVIVVDESLEYRLALVCTGNQPRRIAEQPHVRDMFRFGVPFALLRFFAFLFRRGGPRVDHRAE